MRLATLSTMNKTICHLTFIYLTSIGMACAQTPVSITPASGTGTAQTFQMVTSDTNGNAAIGVVFALINSSLS